MGGELDGEDGRINDTDVSGTVDLEVGIDSTTELEREHSERARRVELSTVLANDPVVPVLVGGNRGTGEDLVDHVGVQRGSVTDLAGKLETLTEHDLVSGVRHVGRVDDGVVEGVRGVDVETTLTERMLQSSLDGDGSGGAQGQQDLNLTNGCEESVGSDIVDSLVTFNDSGICAGNKLAGRIAQSTGD